MIKYICSCDGAHNQEITPMCPDPFHHMGSGNETNTHISISRENFDPLHVNHDRDRELTAVGMLQEQYTHLYLYLILLLYNIIKVTAL